MPFSKFLQLFYTIVLKLGDFGLNKSAFKYAWKGYLNLYSKGQLANPGYFSIVDFSQSSKNKRLIYTRSTGNENVS